MKKTYVLSIDEDTLAKYLDDDSITFELNNQKLNVSLENLKEVITQIEAYKTWANSQKAVNQNTIKAL